MDSYYKSMKHLYELFDHNIVKKKIIIFLGPPLVEKDKQADFLAKRLGMVLLVVQNIDNIYQELSHKKYAKGVVLSGFLKEINNVTLVDKICEELDMEILCVVNMTLSGDRLDRKIEKLPRTPNVIPDATDLYRREIEFYNTTTREIIDFYAKQNLIINIEADKGFDEVKNNIYKKFDNFIFTSYYSKKNIKVYDQLSFILKHINSTNAPTILNEFREQSLKENIHKKTGQKRRYIYVLTTHHRKYEEIVSIFDQYGIEVLWCTSALPIEYVYLLLGMENEQSKPLVAIQEKTYLLRYNAKHTDNKDLYVSIELIPGKFMKCINYSTVTAHELNSNKEPIKTIYEHKTPGYIDYSKRSILCGDIFGWDDIFVVENSNLTYEELKKKNLKISSRNMNISKWIEDKIYYTNKVDHNFDPIHAKRPVDFDIDPFRFIESHKYYSMSEVKASPIYNVFVHVINNGLFFKSAINRRMNNYWLPGLNGGLPMVPKKDEIHETTFMTHDFGHFALPDLLFTGNHSSKHRMIYIAWRMLSEAVTMSLADMLFIDIIKKKGIQYDYRERKIYPLFEDLGINLNDKITLHKNLKNVIYAHYRYCLLGDDTVYKSLLDKNGSSYDNLNKFKVKYRPFYVQDYKWTNANYQNMVKNADNFRYWYRTVKDILPSDLMTIDEVSGMIDSEDFVEILDFIFEYVYENRISKYALESVPKNPSYLKNAFLKYMCGQFMIFARYNFVDHKKYTDPIFEILKGDVGKLEIEQCRGYYEEFLKKLLKQNLITTDDYNTYKEVYPIFDPSYLSYDVRIDEDIIDVVNNIIIEKEDPNENKYHRIMKIMLNNTGYEDKIFIYKPNVIILSKVDVECLENSITFLIAGISAETSMELIAHGEAKVARLTTSKTKSMDNPMYRIFPTLHGEGIDTVIQKEYINNIIKIRDEYKGKLVHHEVYNTLNIGCKTTALTYTMTLGDLHKLFIGRVNFNGNESEVREVIKMMIDQTHGLFPNVIKTHNEYTQMSNADKYKPLTVPILSPNGNYVTQLTPQCKKIFTKLNINSQLAEYLQMTEFRSRITYLTFSKQIPTVEKSLDYLKKIVIDFEHLSVTNAFQIIKVNNRKIESENFKKIYERNIIQGNKNIIIDPALFR